MEYQIEIASTTLGRVVSLQQEIFCFTTSELMSGCKMGQGRKYTYANDQFTLKSI